MKREFSVVVDDSVAGISAALKADNDVTFFGEDVSDLSLSLVAPVSAYNCFYHSFSPLYKRDKYLFTR